MTCQLLLHPPADIGGRQPSERSAPIPTCQELWPLKHDSGKHSMKRPWASMFVTPCSEVVGQAWPSTFCCRSGLPEQQDCHYSVAKAAHRMKRWKDSLESRAQMRGRISVKAGATVCSDRAKQNAIYGGCSRASVHATSRLEQCSESYSRSSSTTLQWQENTP